MSGTTTGIVVLCVVVVVSLAIWLVTVALAARRPGQEHPKRDPLRGLVQGGQHVGGGRSVAPTRDAPVPEGGGNPPSVEEEDEAAQTRSQPPPPELRQPDGPFMYRTDTGARPPMAAARAFVRHVCLVALTNIQLAGLDCLSCPVCLRLR